MYTLPETNSKFAPENGWLEYYMGVSKNRGTPKSSV